MSNPILTLNSSNFDETINKDFTLVDFWAEWCAPCKALAPVLEEIANKYDGKLKVAKVDIDNQLELATRYGVRSVPTILLFKDGKQINMVVGNQPDNLRETVEREINSREINSIA